ncbi:MAG: hypothetical protein WC335_07940 [Candidatus Omnitrophota bacterium]|jgi:hypothetical protein
MKSAGISIVVSLMLFFNVNLLYADASLPAEKVKEIPVEAEKELEAQKKAAEDFRAARTFLYKKIAKRTRDCKDELDNMFLILNSLVRKAHEEKNIKKEKELVTVMSDYNSVLGDLGLMQVVLDLGKFAEGENFPEYYEVMVNGLERLRGSFSLKNEIFLSRIDKGLRNPDALRYEKKLSRIYRDYFEYDPRIDKIEESEEFIKNKEKENKLKER